MALYMKPVFRVMQGNLANKFAASRGAMYFHSVLQAMHSVPDVDGEELWKYAETIKDYMSLVNQYIGNVYSQDHHQDFSTNPNTVFNTLGLDLREQLCNLTGDRKWKIKVRATWLLNLLPFQLTWSQLKSHLPGISWQYFFGTQTLWSCHQERTSETIWLCCLSSRTGPAGPPWLSGDANGWLLFSGWWQPRTTPIKEK